MKTAEERTKKTRKIIKINNSPKMLTNSPGGENRSKRSRKELKLIGLGVYLTFFYLSTTVKAENGTEGSGGEGTGSESDQWWEEGEEEEFNLELDKNDQGFFDTAFGAYYKMNKSLSLTISSTILRQQHKQTMWYIDYLKVREKANKTKGLFAPYLRLITVMERGVYFKRFNRAWRRLEARAPSNSHMNTLFELPETNPITAAMIARNQSWVAVAYKNLTVEVIDINTSKKGINNTLEYTSVQFDTRYKFGVEEDHEVLAIGHIPVSEFLIFSSNRFEIIKANKHTGEVVARAKNPIERIGIIAAPCLSHRKDLDPFNPKSPKNPQLSKKNLEMGHRKIFIATGANDPMNAIVDWTNLKPVKFFSMHLQFVNGKTREEDIIGSIAYYGAIPQGHFYALSTKGYSAYTFIFSGVNLHVFNEISWNIISPNKKVSWIYATTYLSVFYPSPVA